MLLCLMCDKNSYRLENALAPKKAITMKSCDFQTKVLESKTCLSVGRLI